MNNKLKQKILITTSILSVCLPNKVLVANANPNQESININSNNTTVQEQQIIQQQPSPSDNIIQTAKKQLGKPYRWGAVGPNAFDCSGLVYYSYKNGAGITLPRSSREQAKVGVAVNKANLQSGDLVFFATSGGRSITHVGIYVGEGQFIHATQPGDVMKIDSMNSPYYTRTYVTARRVL